MTGRAVRPGGIVSGQQQVVWDPRIPRHGRPAVIWTHGLLDNAVTGLGHDNKLPRDLVANGYTIIAHNFHGPSWGNNDAMADMDAVVAYALGRGHTEIHLVGNSMGCAVVARWARLHPNEYTSIVVQLPALTLQHLYDDGGFAASLDTAYGSWAANRQAVDPLNFAAHYSVSRMQVWYSTNDSLILPAWVHEFCAKAGIEPLSVGALDHSGEGDAETVIAHFEYHASAFE